MGNFTADATVIELEKVFVLQKYCCLFLFHRYHTVIFSATGWRKSKESLNILTSILFLKRTEKKTYWAHTLGRQMHSKSQSVSVFVCNVMKLGKA